MRKAVFFLAPMLLATSGGALAAPPAWQVSETAGEVRIVEQGRSRAAARGALLSSGATVATGPQGRAVLVRGQQFVIVSPASRVRIPEAAQSRGGVVQMLTDFGTALFRIDRRDTPHFGVDTPYLAAVVKGTTFTVSVGPAGASVQVTEGAVEVATLDGGAAELVRAGMIARVGAGDLYRLSIDGEGGRVVRSPNAPQGRGQGGDGGGGTGAAAARGPVIAAPVGEEPVSLSDLTGGLLEGTVGVDLALAATADVRRAERADPADPPGGGKPDDAPGGGNPGSPPGGGNPGSPPGGGNPGSPPGGGNPGSPPGGGNPGSPPGGGQPGSPPGGGQPDSPPGGGQPDSPPGGGNPGSPPGGGQPDSPPGGGNPVPVPGGGDSAPVPGDPPGGGNPGDPAPPPPGGPGGPGRP